MITDVGSLELAAQVPNMAHSLKQSSRIPLRPLDDSIRDKLETEYCELHDKQYQYEEDIIDLGASRAAPSKFRDTSSPVSPVASVRNLDLQGISLRIYEPHRVSPLALVAGVLYIHGGILPSAYWIYAAAEAQTGGYVGGSLDSEEHIPSRYCHGQSVGSTLFNKNLTAAFRQRMCCSLCRVPSCSSVPISSCRGGLLRSS